MNSDQRTIIRAFNRYSNPQYRDDLALFLLLKHSSNGRVLHSNRIPVDRYVNCLD